MRAKWIPLISLTAALISAPPTLLSVEASKPAPKSEEEALFVRRIIEFWRDKEYGLVKGQIKEFFQEYPESSFVESFWIMLGDVYFKERKFYDALLAYDRVMTPSLLNKSLGNRAHCYYKLESFVELEELIAPHITEGDLPEFLHFYYAEAIFRQAIGLKDVEKAQKLCRIAQSHYEKVQNTEHAQTARIALAEINRVLGDHVKAATLYLDLADALPENREKMLFNAATMQMIFDKSKAVTTFSEIFKMNGKKASEAAYNWMLLMFGMERFDTLIQSKEKLLDFVSSERKPLLHFILGNSYFAGKEYEEALTYLSSYLSQVDARSSQLKEALLMGIASSFHLEDIEKVDAYTFRYETVFPEDPNLGKALFFRALINRKHQKNKPAERDLKLIIAKFPNFEDLDAVHFELCALLYHQAKWRESHEAFSKFIIDYTESPYAKAAQRYLLNTSVHLVDSLSGMEYDSQNLRRQLIEDIQNAVEVDGVVDASQKPGYRLKLGRTLFELGSYEDALGVLQRFMEEYPSSPDLFQIHLLMALSYREKTDKDLKGFTFHGEKVLSLNPEAAEKGRLRLNLFTAYLNLEKEATSQEEKELYKDKAAQHLYAVILDDDEPVQLQNRLWLANYYLFTVQKHMEADWRNRLEDSGYLTEAERSMQTFDSALNVAAGGGLALLTEKSLFLEAEVFKFSMLLGWLQQWDQKLELLEQLRAQQAAHPEWKWNLKGRTLISLGELYHEGQRDEKALEVCDVILKEMKTSDPYSWNKAQLLRSRIAFLGLDVNNRTEESEEMLHIFKTLKDLQIRKQLVYEPIHIEAALDYADMKMELASEDTRQERLLFYLHRIKEDFTLQEDIWSKDYSESRKLLPEKNTIYQAYMMLIDAQIAQIESEIARAKGASHEANSKEKAARTIFVTLLRGQFAVSRYLVERAIAGLSAIDPTLLSQYEEAYESPN